jgi:hypothetical protein
MEREEPEPWNDLGLVFPEILRLVAGGEPVDESVEVPHLAVLQLYRDEGRGPEKVVG